MLDFIYFVRIKFQKLLSTSDTLYLHIKRAYYQSLIWKKAYCPSPTQPEVIDDGWKWTENELLKQIFMTKDAIPEDTLMFTSYSCNTGCSTQCCGCKNEIQCSLYCK